MRYFGCADVTVAIEVEFAEGLADFIVAQSIGVGLLRVHGVRPCARTSSVSVNTRVVWCARVLHARKMRVGRASATAEACGELRRGGLCLTRTRGEESCKFSRCCFVYVSQATRLICALNMYMTMKEFIVLETGPASLCAKVVKSLRCRRLRTALCARVSRASI